MESAPEPVDELVVGQTDATVLAFPSAPDAAEDEIDDDDMTATDIDDLFARIRADQPAAGAIDEAAEPSAEEPEHETRSGAATRRSCR